MYQIIEIDGEFKIVKSDGIEVDLNLAQEIIESLKSTYPPDGYVYLIERELDGMIKYKIGATSRSPEVRLGELKDYPASHFQLIHSVKFRDRAEAFHLESTLHDLFEIWGKRLQGEWFKLDSEHIQFICSLNPETAFIDVINKSSEIQIGQIIKRLKKGNPDQKKECVQLLKDMLEVWTELHIEIIKDQ